MVRTLLLTSQLIALQAPKLELLTSSAGCCHFYDL